MRQICRNIIIKDHQIEISGLVLENLWDFRLLPSFSATKSGSKRLAGNPPNSAKATSHLCALTHEQRTGQVHRSLWDLQSSLVDVNQIPFQDLAFQHVDESVETRIDNHVVNPKPFTSPNSRNVLLEMGGISTIPQMAGLYIYTYTYVYIHIYIYTVCIYIIYIYSIYGMMLTTVFGNHVCIGEFLLLGLLEGGVISGKTHPVLCGSVLVYTVNARTCLRIGSYNAKKTSSKIAISGKDPFQPINCPHLQAMKCRIRLGKAVELRTQKAVHSWGMTETKPLKMGS